MTSAKLTKFKLKSAGVRSVLKSAGMGAAISNETAKIHGRCGGAGAGYGYEVKPGKNRIRGTVWTDTFEARRDNAKNNTLLKGVR